MNATLIVSTSTTAPALTGTARDMVELLQTDCLSTRRIACRTLGQLGTLAYGALPALREVSEENCGIVSEAADAAITEILRALHDAEHAETDATPRRTFLDRLLTALGAIHC